MTPLMSQKTTKVLKRQKAQNNTAINYSIYFLLKKKKLIPALFCALQDAQL